TSKAQQCDFSKVKAILVASISEKHKGAKRWDPGKGSEDWLRGEFEASLNSYRNSKNLGQASLCVVYPTAENIRTRRIHCHASIHRFNSDGLPLGSDYH
ncbi:hypothetical protein BGX23_000755, partial [Mortierella sp. AD031]